MTNKIDQLKAYAFSHYDNGAHWILETYNDDDYNNILEQCSRNVNFAKQLLRAKWELTESVARDIQGYGDSF